MTGSPLTKLALALSVVMLGGTADAMAYQRDHPLLTAPLEEDYVQHPSGGASKRLEWSRTPREKSRSELIQMRKQRAVNDRIKHEKLNSWTNSFRQWFGLMGACNSNQQADMPILNYVDETFNVRITVTEAPTEMRAILDTSMAHTVIETTDCSNCDSGTGLVDTSGPPAGLTISATAVSGTINNPPSSYSGLEGTTTFCIAKTGEFSNPPTSANIVSDSMTCLVGAEVHFADTVATPNADATAYIGIALGNGADFDGNTPASTDLVFKELNCDGQFGLRLERADGDDEAEGTTGSFMDLGFFSTNNLRSTVTKKTVQFNNNEFYWKTAINGIWLGTNENTKFGLKNESVIIETGQQCTYIPEDYYEDILNRVMEWSSGYFFSEDGETLVDCGDVQNLLTMRYLVNDKWIETAVADFLNPITTEIAGVSRSTGLCRVCIKQSPDVYWHLGTSALLGYYTEFDMLERTIAFTPLDTSQKMDIESGERPSTILGLSWQTVLWISLSMATLVTLTVLLCLAVCYDMGPFHNNKKKATRGSSSANKVQADNRISLSELETLLENALLKRRLQQA